MTINSFLYSISEEWEDYFSPLSFLCKIRLIILSYMVQVARNIFTKKKFLNRMLHQFPSTSHDIASKGEARLLGIWGV